MAELTISDLRNLEAAESSLLFAVDGDTETFNLTLNTLFEYTKDRLGYLETGAIEMYTGEVIPDTHTELDGKSFDPLVFPKMGALFPAGTLPDTRGMTLKHAPNGRAVLSFEAEAVKSHTHSTPAHTHTASFTGNVLPAHIHNLNVMNSATHSSWIPNNRNVVSGGYSGTGSGLNSGPMRSVSAGTPSGSVTVNSGGAGTTGASGSAKNLVDNIAVKFIIKKA